MPGREHGDAPFPPHGLDLHPVGDLSQTATGGDQESDVGDASLHDSEQLVRLAEHELDRGSPAGSSEVTKDLGQQSRVTVGLERQRQRRRRGERPGHCRDGPVDRRQRSAGLAQEPAAVHSDPAGVGIPVQQPNSEPALQGGDDTEGCETCKHAAASVKLPVSATATNIRSCRRSTSLMR